MAERAAPTVAVLAAGVVGARVVRELISDPGAPAVEVHSAREDRRHALARAFGGETSAPAAQVSAAGEDRLEAVSPTVQVVVLAGIQDRHVAQARRHLADGRQVVSVADDVTVVRSLLDLDHVARERGVSLVVGAAFSPGLTCLLAARSGSRLDVVEEVHVSRHGAAGPACAQERLVAMRREAREWRDGAWEAVVPGTGRELCWFPDPVGGRDCWRVGTGEPQLLVDALPGLRRASVRMAMSRRDRAARLLPMLLPAPGEGGVGAVRVEVRGSRDGERHTSVLGALDRPGVATAAVVSETVLGLLRGEGPSGSHGLASWPHPDRMLMALRRRGLRVAEFTPG